MYDAITALRAGGCVFAEEEAALLSETSVDEEALRRLVAARAAGAPLEQLVGWAEFDGLRVRLQPGVFVPRQRSLLLVELAARLAAEGDLVVDLCCGSGALLAALLRRRPDLQGHAADLDSAATECARLNLDAARVHEGDLFDALPAHVRAQVGVLLVNAPYVPSSAIDQLPREARDHEHRLALDGGDDGLGVHRRVAAEATAWLAPAGVLLIEVAEAQVTAAIEMLDQHRLRATVHRDRDRGATAIVAEHE